MFFNETASIYIQFISMFLEVTGITLAYIEIRYKPLANAIETKILSEEERIRNWGNKLIENKFFSGLITIFIIMLFFIVIPYMAGFYDRVVPPEWENVKVIVIWATLPIIFLFVGGILIMLLGDFITWLNHFSNGHAIGAFGVVVTFLGLLGETYQVFTIWFGAKN